MSDEVKPDVELSGMADDADCAYCATKHMGTAYTLWCEHVQVPEYRLEFVMAIGELRAAELHLMHNYPELSNAVRELRLSIEDGAFPFVEFRELMLACAERAGMFRVERETGELGVENGVSADKP